MLTSCQRSPHSTPEWTSIHQAVCAQWQMIEFLHNFASPSPPNNCGSLVRPSPSLLSAHHSFISLILYLKIFLDEDKVVTIEQTHTCAGPPPTLRRCRSGACGAWCCSPGNAVTGKEQWNDVCLAVPSQIHHDISRLFFCSPVLFNGGWSPLGSWSVCALGLPTPSPMCSQWRLSSTRLTPSNKAALMSLRPWLPVETLAVLWPPGEKLGVNCFLLRKNMWNTCYLSYCQEEWCQAVRASTRRRQSLQKWKAAWISRQ